jgi:two-component system cell cycle sensor histidine kinase/response regulator CckA
MAYKTMKAYSRHRGTESILLVEDNNMVSALTTRILERSGYTVLTAANGKEALDLYEKERDKISLIILDLIMPEMGGKQCLEELRQMDPTVKIVVTSGYAVSGPTKATIESAASSFVGKPYNVDQILGAVRDALDSD